MMQGRILIVDDEQSMGELLHEALGLRGFESAWFTSAEDAFRALKDADYDVVLTDLKMPGVSGLELCERISANRPDIPVVVMTAFGSMDTAVAAIRVGAYDFITKPIEIDMLALTLGRAVGHRQLQYFGHRPFPSSIQSMACSATLIVFDLADIKLVCRHGRHRDCNRHRHIHQSSLFHDFPLPIPVQRLASCNPFVGYA